MEKPGVVRTSRNSWLAVAAYVELEVYVYGKGQYKLVADSYSHHTSLGFYFSGRRPAGI